MRNSGISIIKSVANLKISWSFFIRKIQRSTRTLDCDKYRLKSKGKFFSFCWAIFLYFSTPISWVMSYDKKCPRFVDPVRGWVNESFLLLLNRSLPHQTTKSTARASTPNLPSPWKSQKRRRSSSSEASVQTSKMRTSGTTSASSDKWVGQFLFSFPKMGRYCSWGIQIRKLTLLWSLLFSKVYVIG